VQSGVGDGFGLLLLVSYRRVLPRGGVRLAGCASAVQLQTRMRELQQEWMPRLHGVHTVAALLFSTVVAWVIVFPLHEPEPPGLKHG